MLDVRCVFHQRRLNRNEIIHMDYLVYAITHAIYQGVGVAIFVVADPPEGL